MANRNVIIGASIAIAIAVLVAVGVTVGVLLTRHHNPKKTTTTAPTTTQSTTPWVVTAGQKPSPAPAALKAQYQAASNFLKKNMDQSAAPCKNFYQYACGNYKSPQPDNKYWGTLSEASTTILNNALSAVNSMNMANYTAGPFQYLKAIFNQCSNPNRIQDSLTDIQNLISVKLGGTKYLNSSATRPANPWTPFFRLSQYSPSHSYVETQVSVDPRDKSTYALYLTIKPPVYTSEINQIMGGLTGYNKAVLNGNSPLMPSTVKNNILTLSTLIVRNVPNTVGGYIYKTSYHYIQQYSSNFASALCAAIPVVCSVNTVNIWINVHPSDIYSIERYLKGSYGSSAQAAVVGMFLGNYFNENGTKSSIVPKFHVYGTEYLHDTMNPQANCVQDLFFQEQAFLAWPLTRVIVDKFGPRPKDKTALTAFVENLRSSFDARIKQQTWLDAESMIQARLKLAAIKPRLIYPDWILNDYQLTDFYSTLKPYTGSRSFADLNSRVSFDFWEELVATLSKPTSPKSEHWAISSMSTLVTNAYYMPTDNTINILLGILQKPVFDASYPPALVYGMLGAIVGHEMTHGFDSNGVNYDATGKVNPWLSAASKRKFAEKTMCFKNQFSKFCYPKYGPGNCVNGVQTVTENIADRGGVDISWHAYRSSLSASPMYDLPGLESLTNDQQYLVSYGSVWCTHLTKAGLKYRLKSDVHSPGPSRINGTLQDFLQLSYAYNCPPGTVMHPPKICDLW